MQKEVEESNERLFRAEKREDEARKEEEEKWKDKLDEVVKVSKLLRVLEYYKWSNKSLTTPKTEMNGN